MCWHTLEDFATPADVTEEKTDTHIGLIAVVEVHQSFYSDVVQYGGIGTEFPTPLCIGDGNGKLRVRKGDGLCTTVRAALRDGDRGKKVEGARKHENRAKGIHGFVRFYHRIFWVG